MIRYQAGWNTFHLVFWVAEKEEWHRVSFLARFIDHPMNRGAIFVIRPTTDQIAQVDNERTGHGLGTEPDIPGVIPDLQSTDTIL